MSNLIKSVYFNFDMEEKCIIPSDERVEALVPEIYQNNQIQDFSFAQFDEEDGEGLSQEELQESFEDGISMIHMDDVREEERERLSLEMEEQIRLEQEQILAEARAQADIILQEANDQVEALRSNAMEEGRQLGMQEGRIEAEKELTQMRAQLQDEYEARYSELEMQEKNLEPAFADLVIKLVKKLTGVVCEDKKGVILYLLGTSLHNLGKSKQVMIRVSKEDIARVTAQKAALKTLAGNPAEFDVVEDDSLSELQCIIETDEKMIDCSLDAQLENLEEHMKLLAQ